jgi:polyhydroxyalkanoate synthesis regulator phasin
VVPSGREQYLQALASLSELTRAQAERVAGLLAKQGEVQSAQVGRVAEDMMRRTQKNREILTRLVQREVKRQLGLLGMATRDEVARLQQRVRALEQAVERSGSAATSGRGGRSASASTRAASPGSAGSTTTRASTRATRTGSAGSTTRATRSGSAGSGGSGTTRSSTRTSRAKAAGSGSTRPSTRTRTGGVSSRSTASSPGTRRPSGAEEPESPEGTPTS